MSTTPQAAKTPLPVSESSIGMVDADIHHVPASLDALKPYLPVVWQNYVEETDYTKLPNAPLSQDGRAAASAKTPYRRTARRVRASRCCRSRCWTPTG